MSIPLNQALHAVQVKIADLVGADRAAPFFGDRSSQDLNDPTATPAPNNLPAPSTNPRPFGTGDTEVLVVPLHSGVDPSTRRTVYCLKVGVSMTRATTQLAVAALGEAAEAITQFFGREQTACLEVSPGTSANLKLDGEEKAICYFSPETMPEAKHLKQVGPVRIAFGFIVEFRSLF